MVSVTSSDQLNFKISPVESKLMDLASRCGCTDEETFQQVLVQSRVNGEPWIGEALSQRLVDEDAFLQGVADMLHMDWWENPNDSLLADEFRQIFPAELAIRYHILPVDRAEDKSSLTLATYDPFDLTRQSVVSRRLNQPVRWVVASRTKILEGLQELYGLGADTFEEILSNRDDETPDNFLGDEAMSLDQDDEEATVLKFVNHVLREALRQRATDIHLEPMEDRLRIRFRVDGRLSEVPAPANIKAIQSSVISRLKIMSKLDIAEKRLPQDGRIHLKLDGKSIDVRVATIPSVEGESISLRLLGQETFSLTKLGLNEHLSADVNELLAMPNGIILITGPTGSGKSTSLYCFLSEINTTDRRIVTVEDPVENKLSGVVQIAVKPEIDLTFAKALRSILRGDPDVVMVGEMRDLETTEIAIRAALTGHLVFSTLHTNDAISGITRLLDMGVEPFLVASSVRAFIAQRLVRQLCEACKTPKELSSDRLAALGLDPMRPRIVYQAKGCQKCRGTGFHGRLALYELAKVSATIEDMITRSASRSEILQQAQAEGFRSMRKYGLDKVFEGLTTIEEVLGVTPNT